MAKLTKKELLAAAKGAEAWPKGIPERWFRDYERCHNDDILAQFNNGEIDLPDG